MRPNSCRLSRTARTPTSAPIGHFDIPALRRLGICFGLISGCLLGAGCRQQESFHLDRPSAPGMQIAIAHSPPSADHARDLAMFAGRDGAAMSWPDVMDAAAWADVIIVGEQHDDAVGHAVELAVVQDTMNQWPSSALSMEMLERDEQPLVDDYLDGIIDKPAFAKFTFSESWAGTGSWKDWYQPIIDAAKDAGGRVIAANAPQRYVRIARTDGYARLKSLPASRRKLFDIPIGRPSDQYRQRFIKALTEPDEPTTRPASQPASAVATTAIASTTTAPAPAATKTVPVGVTSSSAPATSPASRPAKRPSPHGGSMTPEEVDAGLRSQSLWDATMAASIVKAKRSGAPKVVHVVGQFHCDFEGGTVQQIRRRSPSARILVISMQREDAADDAALRAEDRNRADIVIYTGKPPPEPSEIPEAPKVPETPTIPP